MLDTSSVGFPVVASTATEPAMSLTRSPVTSSNSRLVGVSMLHSLVGIPPVLLVGLPSTPNDISHFVKVKMYREWEAGAGENRPAGATTAPAEAERARSPALAAASSLTGPVSRP